MRSQLLTCHTCMLLSRARLINGARPLAKGIMHRSLDGGDSATELTSEVSRQGKSG